MTVTTLLIIWAVTTVVATAIVTYDLSNQPVSGLMKVVWGLTTLYSGVIGLAVYYWSGRKEIATDSIWRRGLRSTAHCYSGCGIGEILGVTITVGVLSLSGIEVSVITFVFAYTAGMILTIGPLIQDGVTVMDAITDAFTSETVSITVMEVVAISVDLHLTNGELWSAWFWVALIISLSVGFVAAYPVNIALIQYGVKEGMHDPRMMAEGHHHQ